MCSAKQTVTSVGIDIGTTTTQLIISRLTIKNTAPGCAVPRMEITEKEVLYRSGIHFTPLKDNQIIDAAGISRIVESEYLKAKLDPAQVATGAVIITGESAKKENAKNIVESLAGLAGDFVVATAGVNLESILAGKGAGAAAYSLNKHRITANIDVGGGTANIGIFQEGRVIDTACLNLGGHLIQLEPDKDKVIYIAEPARKVLKFLGIDLQVGERLNFGRLQVITDKMTECIVEAFSRQLPSELTRELLMTPPLTLSYPVEKIMFSGGVADYVYGDFVPVSVAQISNYGDIGPMLGWSIRRELVQAGISPEQPVETIRATVIGAGAHSVNLSGSTINVRNSVLPIRNATVISPFDGPVDLSIESLARDIDLAVGRVMYDGTPGFAALALTGPKEISFPAVQQLAAGIVRGMQRFVTQNHPLIIVLEKDCAKVLGQCIQPLLGESVGLVCIDQVLAREGDYIDIGKPLMAGRVVPVVVKTLVFEHGKQKLA